MKYFIAFSICIYFPFIVLGQILWNPESDTLQLSPKVLSTQGTIMIRNVRLSGNVELDYNRNEFYFKDNKSVFRMEKSDVQGITLHGYGTFTAGQLFSSTSYEANLKFYRSRLFPLLKLNKILFSLSKGTSYIIKDNSIAVNKERILTGKIISISAGFIRVIDEEGTIYNLEDNDFNYVELLATRYFNCNSIYRTFYRNYEEEQEKVIAEWKRKITILTVNQLMSARGPFDELQQLNKNRKLLIWQDNQEITIANSYTEGFSRSSSWTYRRTSLATDSKAYSSAFESIPSLFLYGQVYRTQALALTSSTISSNEYSNKRTVKTKFSVLIDESDVILDIYHLNIFRYPEFGDEFIFCNF